MDFTKSGKNPKAYYQRDKPRKELTSAVCAFFDHILFSLNQNDESEGGGDRSSRSGEAVGCTGGRWAEVFHRLDAFFQFSLSASDFSALRNLVQIAAEIDALEGTQRGMAEECLNYFRTHTFDPSNSLVTLQPSENVIGCLRPLGEILSANVRPLGEMPPFL